MKYLKVIAFTHKQIELKELGKLVICQENLTDKLRKVKALFDIPEIFYLATCNRVEFVMASNAVIDADFAEKFISALDMGICQEHVKVFLSGASIYEDTEALTHLLRTSCSMESLVVGEKEILAQMRKAYEQCKEAGLTGLGGKKLRGAIEGETTSVPHCSWSAHLEQPIWASDPQSR